jgi:cellulose synthase/poly-beta-1,6-N-acetylglucosamine synthase-like glycosyltransferase
MHTTIAQTRKQLCKGCSGQLELSDKVIRRKTDWFHTKCFKPVVTEFDKIGVNLAENPAPKGVKLRCLFCRDTIESSENPVKIGKSTYHQICYDITTPQKEQGVKEKKVTRGHKGATVDPVLLCIMAGIFATLFVTAYIMLSVVSIIAIIVAMGLSFYHIIDSSHSARRKKIRRVPSYFVFVMIAMPIVFGVVIAYEGYSIWHSMPKAIIVWGLTLTFWSNMVFIPLSAYSRYIESSPLEKTYKPFVSIIIPAYNEEKVIARTIESAIATDYPRKEIIAIDDGSTDRTLRILETYKPRIKVIHKENGGKFTALNYGLLYSKGEIIVSVDADTILAPQSITAIVHGFRDKDVGAVAGNIKVRNRTNWITWCQALEYVAGIQIFRRTLDFFNSVAIVPGALGAFRKSFLQRVGNFAGDTLAEDFDATLKILKSGKVVGGRIDSRAYTESPNSISQFYRQRKRWYRGDMQVLTKHKDSLVNPKFGTLYKMTYPLMITSMFFTPLAGIVVWTFSIIDIINGGIFFVFQMLAIFITLQHLHAALAVRIEGEDPRLVAFSVFFVMGYKQIIDFLLIKSAIETLLGKKMQWTTVKRQGI